MASVPGTTFEREIYNAVLAEVERQAAADVGRCKNVQELMQVIYDINLLVANMQPNPYLSGAQTEQLRLDAAKKVAPEIKLFLEKHGCDKKWSVLWKMPDMFVPTKFRRDHVFDIKWNEVYQQLLCEELAGN